MDVRTEEERRDEHCRDEVMTYNAGTFLRFLPQKICHPPDGCERMPDVENFCA